MIIPFRMKEDCDVDISQSCPLAGGAIFASDGDFCCLCRFHPSHSSRNNAYFLCFTLACRRSDCHNCKEIARWEIEREIVARQSKVAWRNSEQFHASSLASHTLWYIRDCDYMVGNITKPMNKSWRGFKSLFSLGAGLPHELVSGDFDVIVGQNTMHTMTERLKRLPASRLSTCCGVLGMANHEFAVSPVSLEKSREAAKDAKARLWDIYAFEALG